MSTSPPAGCVSRESAVRCPNISFILVKHIKFAYIFRIAYCFKATHIFTARKDISTLNCIINFSYTLCNIFKFIKPCVFHSHTVCLTEITPNIRAFFDAWNLAGWYSLRNINIKMPKKKIFALLSCLV